MKKWPLLCGLLVCVLGCAARPSLGPNAVAIEGVAPVQLAAHSGQLWFANELASGHSMNAIGSVSSDLDVKLYGLPISTFTRGVAADGSHVWFAMSSDFLGTNLSYNETMDLIGELDVARKSIKEIPIPTRGAFPGHLVIGHDKAYFSEENGNAISEISDGRIVEHRLPGGLIRDNSGPTSVATGLDGIYFIEQRNHTIGELTYSNQWVSTGVAEMNPYSSLAGTDAGIWFTDPIRRSIGLIPKAHNAQVVRFRIPWSDATPRALTSNSSGRVCFTTLRPYLGCYDSQTGFHKISIADSQARYGNPDQVVLDGNRLWYSFHGLAHTDSWYGAVGFVDLEVPR